MATTLNMTLLLRRAEFADTCVLLNGEPGYNTKTKEFKIGDGTTAWKELPIANDSQIRAIIDTAIAAHAEGYYTKNEVDKFVEDINAAVDTKLDIATYNAYIETHKNDYTNQAIDDAIAAVNSKFDSYTTAAEQEAIDAEQDRKLGIIEADYLKAEDKTELQGKIDLKADASAVAAMYTNSQIDTLLSGKVDNNSYASEKAGFEERITELEAIDHDKLAADASAAAVATVLDGAPEKFDTLKEIAAWIAEADTAEDAASLVTRVSNLEAINHDAYIDADAELKEELEGKIDAINNHSHSNKAELDKITDGDVALWNAEKGAKALAETKLDASTFTEYNNAHASDYTNKQIDDAIDTDVKDAIDAEVERANAAYDVKNSAATAETNAKSYTDAREVEIKKYADQAESDAISTVVGNADSTADSDTIKGVRKALESGDASTLTAAKAYADEVAADAVTNNIKAGEGIVITRPESGDDKDKTVISHKVYGSGTYTKPDSVSDANFVTGINVENGHVIGASVKSLAEALAAMEFIFDGGTSAN